MSLGSSWTTVTLGVRSLFSVPSDRFVVVEVYTVKFPTTDGCLFCAIQKYQNDVDHVVLFTY